MRTMKGVLKRGKESKESGEKLWHFQTDSASKDAENVAMNVEHHLHGYKWVVVWQWVGKESSDYRLSVTKPLQFEIIETWDWGEMKVVSFFYFDNESFEKWRILMTLLCIILSLRNANVVILHLVNGRKSERTARLVLVAKTLPHTAVGPKTDPSTAPSGPIWPQ